MMRHRWASWVRRSFLQSTAIADGFAAEQTPTNNRRIDIQLRFQF